MRNVSGNFLIKGSVEDFSIDVPGEWEELSPRQFADIMLLLSYRKADKYTVAVSLLTILFQSRNWHILRELGDDEIHALLPLTNFMIETQPPLKNRYPTIKIKRTLYAPAEDLSNIGFGEFCFAYIAWDHYNRTKEVDALNKLIAILYRPASEVKNAYDISGDVRETFNENKIAKAAVGTATIFEATKHAILGWFSVALLAAMEARPTAFPKSTDGVSGESPASEPVNFLSIFRELLGAKWGTIETLKNTNAMFVLDGLEEMNIDFKKQQRASTPV